ncbi:S1 RNA-binding domain-containing protein [Tumebacillus sp. DT12]|uniref:S1 RNA-binding domain-containing protein n=1 Tax=Tumebacillus lacus TaxID=2995335 RepID=A0ABT3WZ52_9BACL|nr:S1 RNA-binding domain-containing protein [Tumebacillus lacus]MCX7569945.1 S1 RNA-binding domain-containing protein [Tumebacillus lacus]
MSIQVGSVVEGKVTGIKPFGAFVEVAEGKTGLVHISQVSHTFVNDINDVLKVGDTVQVKVLNVEESGKISLSIKETQPKPEGSEQRGNRRGGGERGGNAGGGQRRGGGRKQSSELTSYSSNNGEPFNTMADQLTEWAKKSGMA